MGWVYNVRSLLVFAFEKCTNLAASQPCISASPLFKSPLKEQYTLLSLFDGMEGREKL